MSSNPESTPALVALLREFAALYVCTAKEAKRADEQEPPEISWVELREIGLLAGKSADALDRLAAAETLLPQWREHAEALGVRGYYQQQDQVDSCVHDLETALGLPHTKEVAAHGEEDQ